MQLELGDHATDFEHLPYQVELQRCKRYYQTAAYTTMMGSLAGQVGTPKILFEVDGVSEQIAKEALYKASAKLPIKTKTIKRFI